MKASATLLLALAATTAQVRADAAVGSDVISLTKDTFSEVAQKPLSLIEFYAPWCGHCKALAPEYEKAATELKSSVPLAKVDCTEQTELCQEHDVRGYPTIKVFREGEPSEYKGQRTADSIIGYMKKLALPPVSELSADKVKEFAESDKVVIVGFFEDKASDEYKAYEAAANKLRDTFLFGATTEEEAFKAQRVKAPAIVLFKKYDEGKNTFDEKFEEGAIAKFVQTVSVPLMDEIGPENYGYYMESGIPLAYLFVSTPEERKTVGKDIEPLAKEFRGKVNFVYIDASKFGGHAKNLNLKESWPAFVIHESEKNLRYPFDQANKLNAADVKAFVQDFVNGKLEPSLKSEEIPTDNDGDVKVVVGKSYPDIVLDKEKDVLIEFYAPWCGHCKALAPTWEELGKEAKKISDKIVIAKMDGTENDLPSDAPFTVQGFPTIKLVKAGDNEVVDYAGARTLESFIDFLKENAVNGGGAEKKEAKEGDDKKTEEEGHDEL
ncbi:hypothetical protein SpCBS45565_g04242 [Spizellomyces sp. 'palustris']|nr:hypothetical protein SpCBS45565_g04242 [Spizellomyces sp. 'palustris']